RHLAKLSDGDARKCLNALEIGVLTTPPTVADRVEVGGSKREKHSDATGVNAPSYNTGIIHFTLTVAEESIQQKAVVYDRAGDAHYDTISAFIKSMRASDEKGALYWLAKMIHAGEDFRFNSRHIVIYAVDANGIADHET